MASEPLPKDRQRCDRCTVATWATRKEPREQPVVSMYHLALESNARKTLVRHGAAALMLVNTHVTPGERHVFVARPSGYLSALLRA